MAYQIDGTGAGKDAAAFMEGTSRFQRKHPSLDWDIVAGQYQGQLHLTVITPGGYPQPLPVHPTLDMADSVFTALEQVLKSK